jgi:hypothetical protein
MIKNNNFFFYYLIFGVVVCFFFFASNIMATGGPKAVFEEKVFTFEEVLEGEIVTHKFTIRNTGDAPLVIEQVRTSCGCTTAKKPDKIPPGGTDHIVVKGNTNRYGGRGFHKTIQVVTNDPEQKVTELKFDGVVARFAEIEPKRIGMSGVVGEKIAAATIITPTPKYDFKITAVEPNKDLKNKVDIQLSKHKKGYKVSVHNKVSQPSIYRGRIIIKTDSPLKPQFDLYVYCRIKAKS